MSAARSCRYFTLAAGRPPYTAPINGAKLVFPGARFDGGSLYELSETEGMTLSLGVPTIWRQRARCTTLRSVLSRGAAVPTALIEAFGDRSIAIVRGWGMTEMSPLGTVSALKAKHLALDAIGRRAIKAKAGRPVFGVETKIVDDNGRTLPHDGTSVGKVIVRGPWIISGYLEVEEASHAAVDADS